MADVSGKSEFVEAETFLPQQDFNFRGILLRHLERIASLSSKEFRPGFWETKVLNQNPYETTLVYHEDTAEAYINAVDALSDLLFPHFDKPVADADVKLAKEYASLQEEIREKKAGKPEMFGIEGFKRQKVAVKRRLFRELNGFLKKKNYFELNQTQE